MHPAIQAILCIFATLIFVGHFLQRSPKTSGSFAERDLQFKPFYASLTLCVYCTHTPSEKLSKVGSFFKSRFFSQQVKLATHCNTHNRLYLSSLDGYCSTVQGLLDWFEADLGFTELSFIQIGLCVLCVFIVVMEQRF